MLPIKTTEQFQIRPNTGLISSSQLEHCQGVQPMPVGQKLTNSFNFVAIIIRSFCLSGPGKLFPMSSKMFLEAIKKRDTLLKLSCITKVSSVDVAFMSRVLNNSN